MIYLTEWKYQKHTMVHGFRSILVTSFSTPRTDQNYWSLLTGRPRQRKNTWFDWLEFLRTTFPLIHCWFPSQKYPLVYIGLKTVWQEILQTVTDYDKWNLKQKWYFDQNYTFHYEGLCQKFSQQPRMFERSEGVLTE